MFEREGYQKGIEKVLEEVSEISIFAKGIRKVSKRYCNEIRIPKEN